MLERTTIKSTFLLLVTLTPCFVSVPAYAQTMPVLRPAGLRLKTLMRRYNHVEKKFFRRYEKAQTDAERTKLEHSEQNPARLYLPRFLALAKQVKDTEEGAQALLQAIKLALEIHNVAALCNGFDAMLASYSNLPIMGDAIVEIDTGSSVIGVPMSYSYLRRVARQSALPGVRALALFTLASSIVDDPHAWYAEREEARKLLATLKQDYAATSYARQADGFLFQLDNLQIGMTAPEIEAVDAQGVAVKLSDYRGKVVVVDFWGFW